MRSTFRQLCGISSDLETRRNARSISTMKLIVLATAAASAAALSLRVQPKMSVAVFGATGLTGRECTHQLLERGVPVRALCRDPSKLLTPLGSTGKEDLVENDKLYKYKGSVTDAAVRAQRPGCARRWRAVEQLRDGITPRRTWRRSSRAATSRASSSRWAARRKMSDRRCLRTASHRVLNTNQRHRRDTRIPQARPPLSPP